LGVLFEYLKMHGTTNPKKEIISLGTQVKIGQGQEGNDKVEEME
jgi:hypothetical protein